MEGSEIETSRFTTEAESRSPAGLSVEWLGTVSYADALKIQEEAVRDRLSGRSGDRLFLLEHPQVVTLGRSTAPGHLKRSEDELRAQGVDLFDVARGGDVTYHAPGQLVGYPVIDLDDLGRRDVHAHLRSLEGALIDALEEVGIPATRVPGWTGVFVDRDRSARRTGRDRKIASIGIGVRRWVTFHGFALNVTIDLEGFESIVPCGLQDVEMTSVVSEWALEGRGAVTSAAERMALDAQMREIVGRHMARALGPTERD